MSAKTPMGTWEQRYAEEVERSIKYYNHLNEKQPVTVRQMTEEERKELEWQTTEHESYHKLKVIK